MKTKEGFDFSKAKRGPVLSQEGRTRITICLSDDVFMAFRLHAEAAGVGCQTMIDDALRAYLENTHEPSAKPPRRVAHQEEVRVAH